MCINLLIRYYLKFSYTIYENVFVVIAIVDI